ncbi:MAG: preprotein translocase subunit SecG [Gammaproteobacteria bacterium]
MLQSVMIMFHVAVALLIIGVVLLQRGKGAEAGTGFGAGASGTVFGARGSSNFLTRLTAVLATLFFATSLSLAYLAGQQTAPESLLELTLPIEQGADEIGVSGLDAELPVIPSESVE